MIVQKYSILLWDFDGVILDSMHIRDLGFEKVLSAYPEAQVSDLLIYHRANGGLSRYVKFRYFFEVIRNEKIEEEQVLEMAERFSVIMRELLTDPVNLIKDAVGYLERNFETQEMHVVSGSDQNELQYLCDQLGVAEYFHSINGSPTPKTELVRRRITLARNNYALIGDSINDYDAAHTNGIDFYGYNNSALTEIGTGYISKFEMFQM